MHYRLIRRIVLLLAIIIAGFFSNRVAPKNAQPVKPIEVTREATSTAMIVATGSAIARVTRVIDGDTIEIEGGIKVRYIGIDTPETVDPRQQVMCFGRQATAENKNLVEGKEVMLERDISETDRYGRLLRYVYAGDVFVNEYLVRQGYAHAVTYPPDIKFTDLFIAAEKEARMQNRGLWSQCTL